MILNWTGARLEGGQYEKANVNATDNHHSTCLHYAAAAGMKSCVEVRQSLGRYSNSRVFHAYENVWSPTKRFDLQPKVKKQGSA